MALSEQKGGSHCRIPALCALISELRVPQKGIKTSMFKAH